MALASIVTSTSTCISALRISLTRLLLRRKPASIHPEINSSDLLRIQPLELRFPLDLEKETSCSIRLMNVSYNRVAYKVKVTNPVNYCVRPKIGVVMPHSPFHVTVRMRVQKEAPLAMQYCRDKFLVQGIVVNHGTPLTGEVFDREPRNQVDECKLTVPYLPPPTPEAEDGTISKEIPEIKCNNIRESDLRRFFWIFSLYPLLSKELDQERRGVKVNRSHGGVVIIFSLTGILTGLIGIQLGYLVKRT